MTIRASVRISMAPSPILVGRRFRPRFSEARAIFLGPSRDAVLAQPMRDSRILGLFQMKGGREWRKLQSWR
ncbi:hypothetical protein [Burkholderia lata]|nr:hypothetical protein [Burkholderia lata]